MFEQFKTCIARLYDSNQRVVGSGFLISERHLLTCAHVVAEALGTKASEPAAPTEEIRLDFPLVAARAWRMGRVVAWQPLRFNESRAEVSGDIAVLALQQAAPSGAQPARLIQADSFWGHPCRAFGFPYDPRDYNREYDQGVWSAGVLRDRNAKGWVLLEDSESSAYFVQQGFSGGPIWDETLQGVVGMVAAAERASDKRAAFMIPVKLLKAIWPDLPIQASQTGRHIADKAQIGKGDIDSPSSFAAHKARTPSISRSNERFNAQKPPNAVVRRLCEQLTQQRLAIFVGADLPQSVTGLPSRADLARGLAPHQGLDEQLTLAAVTQRVMQANQRWVFTNYMKNQLSTWNKKPQRFHQLLVQLPIEMMITTAYDNLLQQAFEQAGQPLNHLVKDSDVPFSHPRWRTLLRLYGDLSQPDSLIITEDDHYGLSRNRDKENLLDEVRATMRRHAILFLGYDLTDPDFNLLWREVLDRMGRFAIGAYAVWPNLPQDEEKIWQARHIQIIDAEPVPFLEALLAAVEPDRARRNQ